MNDGIMSLAISAYSKYKNDQRLQKEYLDILSTLIDQAHLTNFARAWYITGFDQGYMEGYVKALKDHSVFKNNNKVIGCIPTPIERIVASEFPEYKE